MAKFNWSEVFISIEGEAKYVGHPTAYIRFVKCNFTCQGFNNPENVEISNDVLGYDPADFESIYDIPPVEIGCDSIYSWDNRFEHMWHSGDENDLTEATINVLPHNAWHNPVNNAPVILSITGGEPTLYAKTIPTLLNHPSFVDLEHLLIETNCAVPLSDTFIEQLSEWMKARSGRKITWSNSPKLSVSGESRETAIRPDIAVSQLSLRSQVYVPGNVEQYFKFVCDPSEESFDEVESVMEQYITESKESITPIRPCTPVYIMPMCCTDEQQQEIAASVANMCIDRGYIFCFRVQNSVYSNTVGK